MNLKEVSTKDLIEEIMEREGVQGMRLYPEAELTLSKVKGPAVILVVTD